MTCRLGQAVCGGYLICVVGAADKVEELCHWVGGRVGNLPLLSAWEKDGKERRGDGEDEEGGEGEGRERRGRG